MTRRKPKLCPPSVLTSHRHLPSAKKKNSLFRVIPNMTFIRFLAGNLLAFYLTYSLTFHLTFYLAYLLAFYLGYLVAFYLANLLAFYLE